MTYTPDTATVRQLATKILTDAVGDIEPTTVDDTLLYWDRAPADPADFDVLRTAVGEALDAAQVRITVSWPGTAA
ncbi:hypothetical protein [Streptomyces sp. NPDC015125]|uniref:hypothetical protein n=1 Tax=Streptomyces sp. NPDC015125 TaxID=3364938 RepID=UPI0037010D37